MVEACPNWLFVCDGPLWLTHHPKIVHIMESLKMEEYATSFPFGLAM
jgi:hypothetical protein